MCTGRVDLSFPLRAYLDGADGVLIGGCLLGECHYITEGNYHALGTVLLLRKLMKRIGLDPRRLRIEWISAAQGVRYAEIIDEFVRELGELGPLGTGEGIGQDALKPKLESLLGMVPELKLLIRERLQVRVKSAEAYEKLYANPQVDEWIAAIATDPAAVPGGLPAYYIDPERCVGCTICQKKCPVHAIEGANKTIHVIDQAECTHCGTCYYACPPRIAAIRRIDIDAVPPPVPLEARALAGRSRA